MMKQACYIKRLKKKKKRKEKRTRCLPGRPGSPRSLSPRSWASDRLGCLASCGTGALRRCFRYSLQPRKLTNEESREGIKLVAVRSASTKLDLNSGFEQPYGAVAWLVIASSELKKNLRLIRTGRTHASSEQSHAIHTPFTPTMSHVLLECR